MDKFKGTPGKWIVGHNPKLQVCVWVGASRICVVDNFPHDGATYNAQLIAASPTLLEALQSLVAQFKTVDILYTRDKQMIARAEQAIQKALGGEQNG